MNPLEITAWIVLAAMLLTHYQMRRATRFCNQANAALCAARELKDESVARFAAADAMMKDVAKMQTQVKDDIEANGKVLADVKKASRDLMEFNALWNLGMREEAIALANEAGFTQTTAGGRKPL